MKGIILAGGLGTRLRPLTDRTNKHLLPIILATVKDPRPYGVAEFNGDQLVRIIEKPSIPPSNRIVIGAYLYDADAFDLARTLTPSPRGELEITDLNNLYINRGNAQYDLLRGWWTDAGTIEHLHQAEKLISETGANNP